MRMSSVIGRLALCLGIFFSSYMIDGNMTVAGSRPAHAEPPAFENLADALLPTVVNVSTTTKIKNDATVQNLPDLPQFPPGSPFEDFFKDFYDRYKNTRPLQGDQKVSSLGSGFIIDANKGYIVTNNHVIKDADEIKVILHDDTSLDAKLVGADEKTDIAVLKITPPAGKVLTAASFGDSDQAKVGSWILAIGNPFGLGGTVTAGIISARQRNINAGPYDDFIQTDASINRGNSGGPMFNTKGEVIGVNTAIFSPSGGSVGIGFAIPSNLVKTVTEQLIKFGKTKRGWLGVKIQEVTPEIAESLGMKEAKGAMVAGVTPKGPGEKAGIKTGDIVTSFDGHEIDTMRKLPRLVAESEVGKKVDVKVWRKDGEKDLTVELGQLEAAEASGLVDTAQKDTEGQTPQSAKGLDVPAIGVTVSALDDKAREVFGLGKDATGVVVTDVKPNSAASDVNLMPGDLILQVDQADVAAPKDVAAKIETAKKAGRNSVLFFIGRKDDRRFVAIKIKK